MTQWTRLRTIPDWVKTQYAQYLRDIENRTWADFDNCPATLEERVEFYERIVYNLEGKEFWSAMGSRRESLTEWLSRDLEPGIEINHVELLLEMAFTLSRGISVLDGMIVSERNKTGRRIAAMSSGLMDELRRLRALVGEEHSVPSKLARALSDDTMKALTSIRDDGENWATSAPIVRRPELNDAHSRRFAHGVAEYFGHFYGDTLYAATASLACCVYGSGAVTQSQVREFFRKK